MRSAKGSIVRAERTLGHDFSHPLHRADKLPVEGLPAAQVDHQRSTDRQVTWHSVNVDAHDNVPWEYKRAVELAFARKDTPGSPMDPGGVEAKVTACEALCAALLALVSNDVGKPREVPKTVIGEGDVGRVPPSGGD